MKFFAGMDRAERIAALEKVVAGDLHLHAVVRDGLCVISKLKEAAIKEQERDDGQTVSRNDIRIPDDVEALHSSEDYLHDKYFYMPWEILDSVNTGAQLYKLADSVQMALSIIANSERMPVEVINEKGEVCSVYEWSTHHTESGIAVIGCSNANFDEDSLAIARASYLGRDNRYVIDTPEYAAVIAVWEKYWKDGSGMTQDAIVAELMAEDFTKNRAEAIEMICRPVSERGGGRKKSK